MVVCPFEEEMRKKDNFHIGIRASDIIYPICPDGLYRSQVLHTALLGVKRLMGTTDGVNLPHGASNGFDPYDVEVYDFKHI